MHLDYSITDSVLLPRDESKGFFFRNVSFVIKKFVIEQEIRDRIPFTPK